MNKTSRRKFLRHGVVVGATAAAVAASTVPGQAKSKVAKRVIYPNGKKPEKTPLFSSAVAYGNLLFLSGIGYHEPGDIKEHTKHVLDHIKQQLESAGSSMEKVLKCNVYLNDIGDYARMNEVFQGSFGDEPPVRTTVAVGRLPGNNSLVEIEVIACL
jgi:enamine deaminase RidA (YjgF/YER057c/UK114 family)